MNVFDHYELAARYAISAVPQVFFFLHGEQPVERFVGFQSEQKLSEAMNRLLEKK